MSETSEDAPARLRVRPYTVTRGRTASEVDLALETMVTAIEKNTPDRLRAEVKAIVDLCAKPQSIAEISAHLTLPLQVAKVLVGDLVMEGRLVTNTGAARSDGRPDLALLERVLDGLQSL